MNIFKFFQRKKLLCQDEMVKPFWEGAKKAILLQDLPKAIAYLNRGIKVAPDQLELYLQRGQVFQYGLNNFSEALKDYRFILRRLESEPGHALVAKAREAMRDMMISTDSGTSKN